MTARKWPTRTSLARALHYNAKMKTRASLFGPRRLAVLCVGWLLITTIAAAQPAPVIHPDVAPTICKLPDANPTLIAQTSKLSAEPHVFWDRANLMLFSGVILSRTADYASTRNMQARGREEVLLPDDVVNNSAGFAALESAGTAASVGLSYWMHRTGHHKLERWVSAVHIGVTGFGIARNYSLPTNRAGR
jgi:hypothetical protein